MPTPDKAATLARLVVTAQALRRDCQLLELADAAAVLHRLEERLTEEFTQAQAADAD